jgi:hypothetical protein
MAAAARMALEKLLCKIRMNSDVNVISKARSALQTIFELAYGTATSLRIPRANSV